MYKCHAHTHTQTQTVPNCKLSRPKTTTTTKCEKQQRKTRRKFCRFFSCVKKLSARCALRQNDNLKCPLPLPFQQFPFPSRVEICSPSMPHVDYGSTFPAKNLTVEIFKIFVEIERENERWKIWGILLVGRGGTIGLSNITNEAKNIFDLFLIRDTFYYRNSEFSNFELTQEYPIIQCDKLKKTWSVFYILLELSRELITHEFIICLPHRYTLFLSYSQHHS